VGPHSAVASHASSLPTVRMTAPALTERHLSCITAQMPLLCPQNSHLWALARMMSFPCLTPPSRTLMITTEFANYTDLESARVCAEMVLLSPRMEKSAMTGTITILTVARIRAKLRSPPAPPAIPPQVSINAISPRPASPRPQANTTARVVQATRQTHQTRTIAYRSLDKSTACLLSLV